MALLNRAVLVQYDVPGPILWHERLPLEHLGGEEYIIVTPDRDVYAEELSAANQDLRGVRVRPGPGLLPGDIAANQVYGLPNWAPGDMANLRAEARQAAINERALRGNIGGAGGGAAAAAPSPGRPVDPYPEGQLKWLAAERQAGYVVGQEVSGVVIPESRDARAVHTTVDNQSLFVQCIDGRDLATFLGRNSRGDVRILDYALKPCSSLSGL